MNGIDARAGIWLTGALPFVVVALFVGWETDWGHALKHVPPIDMQVAAQPVPVAVLPEYKIDGGIENRRETVERTLFNPTRRPAPPQTSAAAKPIQTGQFVLTGTTVVDQKATAFLREVNGGRSRRVEQGETINGLIVAEVHADRVKLKAGDQVEELTLKIAAGPKTTIQPAVAVAPPPHPAGAPGTSQPPPTAAAAATGQTQDVADVLASRRRAARAAAATAAAAPQAQNEQAGQPGAVQQSTPATPAQGWNDVYQRYIQRNK